MRWYAGNTGTNPTDLRGQVYGVCIYEPYRACQRSAPTLADDGKENKIWIVSDTSLKKEEEFLDGLGYNQ